MKIFYDQEVDALYVQLNDQQPDGVIEIAPGINLDTTSDGRVTGLEILNTGRPKTALHSSFRVFPENGGNHI